MNRTRFPRLGLRTAAALLPGLLALAATPARGSDEIDVSAYAEISTDLRARGLSQTYLEPGALADILWLHSSGTYRRWRVSNVSKKIYQGGNGTNLQFALGQRWNVDEVVNFDVAVIADVFPGGKTVVVSGIDPNDGTLISKRNSANTGLLQLEAQVSWATLRYSSTLSRNFYGLDSQVPCALIQDELAAFDCLQSPVRGTRGSGFIEVEGNFRLSKAWRLKVSLGHQSVRNASALNWNTAAVWVTHTQGPWTSALGVEQAKAATAGALDLQEPGGQRVKNLGARRFIGSVRYSF